MKLTTKHVEAIKYIGNGDCNKIGMRRSDLRPYIDDLKKDGIATIKMRGDSARLCLTLRGNCVLSSLSK